MIRMCITCWSRGNGGPYLVIVLSNSIELCIAATLLKARDRRLILYRRVINALIDVLLIVIFDLA